MAYNHSNKYAKNLCKRTVLVQLIVKKRGHMLFFGTQCSGAQKHTQHQHIHMHSILKYNHTVTTLVYMDTL